MRFIVLVAFLGCALAASVDRLRRDKGPPRPMPTKQQRPDQEGEDSEHGRVRRTAGDTVKVCVDYTSNLNDADMQASLDSAIQAFEDVSCVDFVVNEANCVSYEGGEITDAKNDVPGCWATIGFTNPNPQINLDQPCNLYGDGVVIHELFHLLGRYHEHVRSDRDDYVTVLGANIETGKAHNFNKIAAQPYEVDYDYESIMHYGKDFFSKGGDTLEILDDMFKHKVGKQAKLSPLDIVTVNKMFDCYVGSIDPYDCDHHAVKNADGVCVCTEPFTGVRCENVDPTVDHKLNTGLEEIELTSANYPSNYLPNSDQHILFECPTAHKAVIEFVDFDLEAWGCGYDKVTLTQGARDIYANTGCGNQFQAKTYTSLDEIIYMTFYSDYAYTYKGYKLKFTCIT